MENNKNPNIRFKGFTDPWEQRKLKEILIQRTEHQKISDDAPLLAFSYAEGVISPEDKKSNKRDFIMTDKYNKIFSRTELNDIIYNPANVVHGAIHRNKLGTGVVSPIYKIFMCNGVSPKFIGERLHTDKFILEVTKFIEGTVVKLRTLSPEMFLEMSIEIPKSYEEQDRIGTYFTNLDNLITLHQRKYNKLLNVKKSMLEKMFPKNGSNIPEIRFKGFTDPWEQRKLNEIADKVTEKNAGLQYIETFTNSAEFGIISQRDFFDHDIAKMSSLGGYYIVRNEDFVYNPRISTSAPVGPTNRNKLGRIGVMSPLYTVFRPHDVDTTYLEYFFKSKYWHSFMNFNGDSGARSDRFSIKDSVFFEMPIPLPYTEEQEKIGQYFSNLDNLITLHQRELEKLQNIKKSMLEKMFV